MNSRRRNVRAALVAIVSIASTLALSAPASADDEDLADPVGDVVTQENGTPVTEPRIDISNVHVKHEARLLEITVTVQQFTPLDDPAWLAGNLGLEAVLADLDAEEFFGAFWFWDLVPDGDGGATGLLLSFGEEELIECETEATADEATRSYTLSTSSCLRDVPRAVSVGAAMSFNDRPDDFEYYDYPLDLAPAELSDPIGSTGAPDVTRLAGPDRIETAIALSADRFEDGDAPAAVLASSDDYPDAIAGGPLAASNGAPLLLTGGDGLDARVAAKLERAVEHGGVVYLLGGSGALGESVATEVRALGYRPKRLAGSNRFETAVAVADEIGDHDITLVADGRSFRDGLIAGAAAASLGGVVVLTDGSHLPTVTDDFLASDAARHVAIGSAAPAGPGAERITAASPYELSQKVLDRLLPNANAVAVAGSGSFADALAGAPHAAALGGGLLLTESGALSEPVRAELAQRATQVREVVLYGGTASISAIVEDAIVAAVS